MSEEAIYDRRRFLANTFMTIAATQLGMATMSKPESNTSFGSVKQIDAGLLNVGYVEDGPANGRPVMLLHGWPYDIHSFEEVAPLLAAKGYRAIASGQDSPAARRRAPMVVPILLCDGTRPGRLRKVPA
jgi:hypothetical protein